MSRLVFFMVLLVLSHGGVTLAETIQTQPSVATFGEFINSHEFGMSLFNTLAGTAGSVGGLLSETKWSELKSKCETFKKSDRCRTCKTTLYRDRNYGHAPKNEGQKRWALASYTGQVFKRKIGNAHRCYVPDSKKLGGDGDTSTFTWDDGKEHH